MKKSLIILTIISLAICFNSCTRLPNDNSHYINSTESETGDSSKAESGGEESADEASASEESDPEISEASGEAGSDESKAEESHPESRQDEDTPFPQLAIIDLIPVDGSDTVFTSEKCPGKLIVLYWKNAVSKLMVVDKTLFTVDWGGEEAVAFEGRRIEYPGNGTVLEQKGYGVLYKGVAMVYPGCEISAKGKLIIFNKQNEYCYVYGLKEKFVDGDHFYSDDYYAKQIEILAVSEGSKYIAGCDLMYGIVGGADWFIADTEGEFYRLPIPDDRRWSVETIEFDPESDDPDDMIITYYERSDEPVVKRFNARDLERVVYGEYYDIDPDYEGD